LRERKNKRLEILEGKVGAVYFKGFEGYFGVDWRVKFLTELIDVTYLKNC